jgi:hypothetical protein
MYFVQNNSSDSSVGNVTWQRPGRPKNIISILVMGKILLSFPKGPDRLWRFMGLYLMSMTKFVGLHKMSLSTGTLEIFINV